MNNEQENTTMNFDIDRLVIHGLELTPAQQRQLSHSLQTSLRQLFEVEGIPKSMAEHSSVSTLPVQSIKLTSETVQPGPLGKQIAHSIYDGLSK